MAQLKIQKKSDISKYNSKDKIPVITLKSSKSEHMMYQFQSIAVDFTFGNVKYNYCMGFEYNHHYHNWLLSKCKALQ